MDKMKETLAQAEFEDDPSATVTVCNELGGFYRAFSRYNEGIPLYEKALGCIRRLGLENSEGHGTTLLNFATTLAIVGQQDRALDAYQQAAGIFEEMDDNLELVARILNAMSVEDRGAIMGVMDAEIAAKLTKIMDPAS